jgi:AcrR family transcriptional regulator
MPGRPQPHDALAAARRMWLTDQRIDMGELAATVGISRPTLYHWLGDREQLTAEVLWSIAEATVADARRAARGSGARYLSDVIGRYLESVAGFAPVRAFILRDPEFALRVLTCSRTPFQRRLIAAVQTMVEEQVTLSGYRPPLDPATLAYVLVRIGESFIFNDVITGTEPDLAKAIDASRALLHAPDVRRPTRRRPPERPGPS